MDYSTTTLLNISPYFKSVDAELESVKIQAQNEIRRRDEQLCHVKELLYIALVERDEALNICQSLLQQQVNNKVNNSLTSSDCDDQNKADDVAQTTSKVQCFNEEVMQMQRLLQQTSNKNKNRYKLPEKGKLLEAVMNAGPLLQTLLLAGQLPQWRHPPPLLESIEIPPVTINLI